MIPLSQAQRFDPQGEYIRRWVPELAAVPAPAVFEPWRHPQALAAAPDYPTRPLVDLAQGRADALAALSSLRGSRASPGEAVTTG